MSVGSMDGSTLRGCLAAVVGIAAIASLSGALVLRRPSPVGHWRSAAGHDEFMAAYDEAMAEGPPPDDVLDVHTDFGVVRLHRFAGSEVDGTPLLLLPGRGSASPVWAGSLERMREFGDVFTLDLLGEPGKSVQARPITDSADQAAWLQQALTQLGEERFYLVGLSIGGWMAVNTAVCHPDLVASLALLDPPFTFTGISARFVLRTAAVMFPWSPTSWREDFDAWLAGRPSVGDLPIARMLRLGQQHYATRLPAPERITASALRSLTMPVLAVLAERSVVHDAGAAASTAEAHLPNAVVKLYRGASHAVGVAEPERVAADLAELLRSRSGSRPASTAGDSP